MLGVVLVIMLALSVVMAGCSAPAQGARVGELAPDFQLPGLDGKSVSLEYSRGRPVMVNFWATWCPPCRSEMPHLQAVYDEWYIRGLTLLAVNIGERSAAVDEFMQSNNLTFTVLLDITGSVAQEYNVSAIPTTFFIDKDGIIQDKVIGAFPSQAEIESRLSQIMP